MPPHARKILVLERDPKSAVAIANLALEVVPPDAEAIVAKAASAEGARRLIQDLVRRDEGPVIIVCAADLDGDGSGLQIIDYARRHHPNVRAVVLTDGESGELATAIRHGAHGIHGRPSGLDGLRTILRFLGSDVATKELVPSAPRAGDQDGAGEAKLAFERALDAVETAHQLLQQASALLEGPAREKLLVAQRHAGEAHRQTLDADRILRSDDPETAP